MGNNIYGPGSPESVGSATDAVAVTPHNTNALPFPSIKGFHVGTAGDLSVTMLSGATLTLFNVSGFVPIVATHVFATGTTAEDITALR